MTQNDEKNNHQQAKLCTKCQDMFGHVNFDNMCSLCYKKQKNIQTAVEKPKSIQDHHSEDQISLPKLQLSTPTAKRQLPKDQPKEQLPKGKCNKCTKKTGMLGFVCKHCSFQFCKFHRLPQDHSCEVDYVTLGRKKIKTENPTISTKKIEDI